MYVMETVHIALTGLALYAVVMVLIGWWSGRSKTHENYVIGGRHVGILPTAISIGAGWRDVAYITFWVSTSYTLGWATFTACIGSITALYILGKFASKFRTIGAERGYVTPGQMIRDYLGNTSRMTYSVLFLAVGIVYVAAQLFVMGSLIGATVGVSQSYTIPAVAVIVAFYLWRGGYGSVILTDIIQGFVILALICLPFFVEANPAQIYDWRSLGNLGWVETMALVFLPFFTSLGSPEVWQRIFSAKDERTVRIALPLGAFCFAMLTFAVVYLGISLRGYVPMADPNNLFVTIFIENVFSPYILAALLVVVFSMGMSTIDTWSYVFSSTMIRDIVRTKAIEDRHLYIQQTRLVVLIFLAVSSLMALTFEDIMDVLMGIISSYAILTPMICTILFGLVKKSNLNDKVISFISIFGFALFVYWQLTDFFGGSFLRSLYPVLITLALILLWCGFCKIKR